VTDRGESVSATTDATETLAPAPISAADHRLEELARERFHSLMKRVPVLATYLGIHDYDGELSDGTRDAVLNDINEARSFAAAVAALDANELSPYHRIERELALFTTRRQIFDDEVQRLWERRVNAADEIGDGVFLTFSRGTRPFDERMASIASRLEAAPTHIEQQQSRLGEKPQRLWNEMELEAVASLPSLFDEVVSAARAELGDGHPEVGRLEVASKSAAAALDSYATWLRARLADADDDFALGAQAYDELVSLRAFDDLDADEILAIGEEQLAHNRSERARLAKEIDGGATELEVVNLIKADQPPDFAAALGAYRRAMHEARQHVIDHDLVSLPAGENLDVIETPEYLRTSLPFAAYFPPPKFGSGSAPKGLYIVTPSVDGDPDAMKEHNNAAIYNTSIHEAYPGHHLQLATANNHPSLIRMLVDAPEFVEGWAMYAEQMMREEGFDTSPEHLVMMYTDAIWRACRIVLDVKLHRGLISVPDATRFLIEQTGFERANAAAEVKRYTYTPTYQFSYLLGKVLLLRLRDDERRRLGPAFSLKGFHDSMLREGSLPISFQRRLLAGAAREVSAVN
jgi:uncharacterized protein (DUF885 family)